MNIRDNVDALVREVKAGEQYVLFPPGSTPPPETKKAG